MHLCEGRGGFFTGLRELSPEALFAERAGIREHPARAVGRHEFVEHLLAAAQKVPALIEARIGAERQRRAEGEGRVLAEV